MCLCNTLFLYKCVCSCSIMVPFFFKSILDLSRIDSEIEYPAMVQGGLYLDWPITEATAATLNSSVSLFFFVNIPYGLTPRATLGPFGICIHG